jgi:hypothetical protein
MDQLSKLFVAVFTTRTLVSIACLLAGLLAMKDLKAQPGEIGDKGEKGEAAAVNVRAVQADGSVSCESSKTLVSVFCPSGGAADGAKCGTSPTVGLCLKKP